MIKDIQFRVIIDDETLQQYLQYRIQYEVADLPPGPPGFSDLEWWTEWKTVQHFMGSKPADLEKIFYAQGT